MGEPYRVAEQLVSRLQRRADFTTFAAERELCQAAADELSRLDKLLNTPHTAEFLEAVHLEAMHQRERWGTEHDEGKTDADWFWLVGYLAGKAIRGDEKAVHHIITTAAALLNWHAAKTGADNQMRPGTAPPSSGG